MKLNQQKQKDVQELKRLKKPKNPEPYSQRKKEISKKYGVTLRAVEQWMQKRSPGVRKTRADSGTIRNPISKKERKIVKELSEKGTDIKKIRKIAEEKTGRKLSQRKIDRIREKTDKEILEGKEEKETTFGDKAKEFFRRLFELDLISPEKGVAIETKNGRAIISKEDIEDICLILANAYNRSGLKPAFAVDKNALLKERIFHLIEQQVRLAESGETVIDTKTIEAITRMYDKMTEKYEPDADILTVERICKELKPDISFTEIIELIKKYSDEK